MDDESAEIELLEQNLRNTRKISKRMTSILDSFDGRLAKLEKSILPLYSAAQILNRRSHNIDQALSKIDEMANTQEDLTAEEALILRGPQVNNIRAYKGALDRLNANIAFKPQDEDSAETARLIETGSKKLIQLYTTLVAEASSSSSSPTSTAIPATILQTLTPLVSYLRTLPTPTTHPSHPAANEIFAALRDAQRGYADMRASWCVKCLEGKGRGIVTSASALEGPRMSTDRRGDPILRIGREFGEWVGNVLAVAEVEYTLLIDLSPLTSSTSTTTFNTQLFAQSYGTLLTPILKLFTAVLNQLTTLIKKGLQKYNFLALSAYDALLGLQPAWDDVLSRRIGGGGEEGSKNEIRDGLSTLRQICLRSFPEFLVDIKLAATGSSSSGGGERDGETSVGIVDVTIETVKYLTRIPPLRAAVASALKALGDGNWKMGEGVQVGKTSTVEVDEVTVLEHFLHDVIINIITSLTTISKAYRRPTQFSSMFLLNNLAYLQHYTSSSPRSSATAASSFLSPSTIDYVNSKFRAAKVSYLEANFAALISTISDEPPNFGGGTTSTSGFGSGGGSSGSSKSQAKERFTRFYDNLDEVIERHRLAKVLWCDDDLSLLSSSDPQVVNLDYDERERDCLKKERRDVEEEVVKSVVPPLKRFVTKMREKEFARNPQKYIKQSPEEVESRLRGIYY